MYNHNRRHRRVPESERTVDGFLFGSKKEMVCYLTYIKPNLREGQRLMIHAKMPLFSQGMMISPCDTLNVDFIITESRYLPDQVDSVWWQIVRAIDAKPKDKAAYSRDWYRGARAFEGSYGVKLEEWTG